MKKLALLLTAWAFFASANAYDAIDEALKNGTASGDLSLFGNYTFIDESFPAPGESKNKNYLVGSLGLAYKSAYYHALRFGASFRAAKPFMEGDKLGFWNPAAVPQNSVAAHNGLQTYDKRTNSVMLGEVYAEYFDGDTNVKAGRVGVRSEWAFGEIDGVLVRNKSLQNTLIEAFWAKNYSFTRYYKMAGPLSVNPFNSLGMGHLSARYDFGDAEESDAISGFGKAFVTSTPSVFHAVGLSGEVKYSTTSIIGLRGNLTQSFEASHGVRDEVGKRVDGSHLGIEAFVGYEKMLNLAVGFMRNGRGGLGSLNSLNNTIVPFLLWGGDAYTNGANASMGYGRLNALIDVFSVAVIYGSTSFDASPTLPARLRQNELDIVLEFGFTEHVKATLSVINTHGGKSDVYPKGTKSFLGIQALF